ncbi:MAG TPA: hypothetical protein VIL20_12690 [Sandaracinaceae bacterium]
MTPERLAEIDRELDAFGKSAEDLRAVVERARAIAAEVDGDEALAALVAGAAEAAARAAASAREAVAAAAVVRPPIREHVPAPKPARPAPGDQPLAFDDDEPSTSVMKAAPVEQAAGAFDDDEPSTSVTSAVPFEQEAESAAPLRSPDIAGMSVDELFADAEPAAPVVDAGGLADLFADEVLPVQEPAPEGGLADLFEDEDATTVGSLADLFDESEELRLSDPELEVERAAPPPPPPPVSSELPDLFDDDAEDEETGHFAPARMARLEREAAAAAQAGDDDFELLVDEDVLELEASAEREDAPPKKPGLLGRLLGKK